MSEGSSTHSSPGSLSPPSPTQDLGSPSIDAVFAEVNLNTPKSNYENGLLSPRMELERERDVFDDVDLGSSIPLPLSPIPTSPTPNRIGNTRLLTRSPSPSPARRYSTQNGARSPSPSPSYPSRSRSPRPSRPASPSSNAATPSRPISPGSEDLDNDHDHGQGTVSPRFVPFKPPLPSATIALNGQVDDIDTSAPFESIELNTTPPPPPSVPMLPSSSGSLSTPGSGNRGKRKSWGGFGIHKDDHTKSASSPSLNRKTSTPNAPQANGDHHHEHENEHNDGGEDDQPEAGPSTPPRLHAPPAHPHPYPLPSVTSPPPIAGKRLSVSSTHSNQNTNHNRTPSTHTQSGVVAHAHGLGVKGTSTFEKVISHTRPSWLPPKDKIEDETHYHQWEEMMAQSREHEKERRKVAEARRLEKEKRLAINTPRWEALLGGEFSVGKVKEDGGLRRLWFEGVPSHLRGKAWSLAIGNPLAMAKESYKGYLARARKALDSGRFPQAILDQMEADMDETLPNLRLYIRGSPMRDDLREFLCTWIVYRSDDGLAYVPYITHLSAMFLLSSPPAEAFLSLVNLLSRPCLRAFYTQTVDEIEAYYRVFENLQADMFPKIYANCKNLGLRLPESYFRSLFLEQIPFEACCRLWDQIVLDGDGYIFRSALAIFGFLEPRLHYPDHDEILSVLEGHNHATLAIQERERERAKLRGEAYDETVDGKLSAFGINEGALFEWLENDGWRESRFERLVSREMPD